MRNTESWWRGAAVYQIYPRSFADSNGDGVGDLPGITARLDYVAGLGVDAIWLSPVFPSPQKDFGYDVADHTGIDPLFGTLADFDALIARAHALGLRVLIDQVWSHTSTQHAWFRDSRARGGKADWYVWADAQPDGTPPNNWLSVFGGSAWTWEPRRRQFYLHHFLSDQPQLNLHNPAVQDALLETGRFWLARGVDGFRLDAVDFYAHDPELRPNPPAPDAGPGVKLFGRQRHVHDMLHPGRHDFLRRIRALLDEFPGSVALGEVSSQDGAFERCRAYTAGGEALHMAYTLKPLRQGFSHATMQALVREAEHSAGLCWNFSNHDVERAAGRWNPEPGRPADPRFARLLAAFQLCLAGSVCLYQGEELGLEDATLAEAELRDPFGIAYWPEFRGRDGSRTPMPWLRGAAHAGFSEATPWLPVAQAHREAAVDVQDNDPDSVLQGWRHFLRVRQENPALRHGTLQALPLDAPVIGFVRRHGGQHMLCLFNFSPDTVTVSGATGGFALPRTLAPYATVIEPAEMLMAEAAD